MQTNLPSTMIIRMFKYLPLALLAVLLTRCGGKNTTEEAFQKPNILFLFTDDQRSSTIHALGNDQIITPNMDRLATEGFVFRNATIMGAVNGAVCAPSRAMLMTGRPLFRIDPTGSTIDSAHTTLPQHLMRNGYETFHTGKWHNGRESFVRSFSTGAKIMFGGMSDHYKAPLRDFSPEGNYGSETVYYDTTRHSSEIYADAAVRFINNYSNERPFFMFVSFQAPHDPRDMPEEYLDMYDADAIDLPPNFMPRHPFDNGELEIRDEWLAKMPRTEGRIRKHIRAYYAMITHVDAEIGRILEALERKGLSENTVIVFAGDNGLAVGQHGLMGKQNLYEHSVRVPLIFAGRGIPRGRKSPAPVYLNDIYPSLCALAGLDVPSSVGSKSLLPILEGAPNVQVRDASVHVYKNFQRAIRTDPYKLIEYNVGGTITKQLFDLSKDPYEMNNLAGQAGSDSLVTTLESELQAALRGIGDEADLKQPGWGVPVIMCWEEKIRRSDPEMLENLREMAAKEHKD